MTPRATTTTIVALLTTGHGQRWLYRQHATPCPVNMAPHNEAPIAKRQQTQ